MGINVTHRQNRVLRRLDIGGDRYVTATWIADAGSSTREIYVVLRQLEKRGLVERKTEGDVIKGWRLSDAGRLHVAVRVVGA